MKLLLNSVLMVSLCDIVSCKRCDFNITHSPDLDVTEGEMVNITCCVAGAQRLSYSWIKHQPSNTKKIKYQTLSINGSRACFNLVLSNININDSGRYFCKVKEEIPYICEDAVNGTIITVTTRQGKGAVSYKISLSVIIPVAVVVLLLLVALCCFCFMRLKRAQAAMVIYEVPHFDSEEAEMEKHSTSSTGSTQWRQVPLYDSLDYFDHTQNKESE
ncbi:uncharacterized protein LOC103385767 [Cynoglossus semilaevis]|uniref:uncharacterized protein LOC103385767 n=1 Tax=Cynoglossus semilaevis TaxID=244447 RepID=UPI0004962715|nr:uncharacterized protein LOC103385767 [Cynoglossus semilaevis]